MRRGGASGQAAAGAPTRHLTRSRSRRGGAITNTIGGGVQVVACVRAGTLSRGAVAAACAERAVRTAALGAFTSVLAPAAAAAAAEKAASVLGIGGGGLHGVPIAVKANLCCTGWATGAASKALEGQCAGQLRPPQIGRASCRERVLLIV